MTSALAPPRRADRGSGDASPPARPLVAADTLNPLNPAQLTARVADPASMGWMFRARPWMRTWLALWFAVVVGETVAVRTLTGTWEHPAVLFWLVVIAAGLCVVTAGAVIVRGWRSGLAETCMLGSFFMSVSVLPLAHGLTVPGILYGPNTATVATVFWAVPVGAIVLLPLASARSRVANSAMAHWRAWIAAHLAVVAACFIVALAAPDALPAPTMGSLRAAIGVSVVLAMCIALSYRHLRLTWIARTAGPFGVSIAAVLVGASSLVFLGTGPWTAGFWLAHALDICGVFAGTIVGAAVYARSGSVRALLAPVEATTPLRALELGLDPLVHRFVAALDAKDPITRDHVVRSAHMAALVADELDVRFEDLATVTLGALLHDVGKLEVPDEILNKAGRLDDEEYAVIKRHPVVGEQLVVDSPSLADLGPIVRGHHERIDGRGYPDGLVGNAIPLGARIVAACDAYDAMSNTRQYRAGMGVDRALAVLAEHAGSQWDPSVVAVLTAVVRRRNVDFDGDALAHVGREANPVEPSTWCGCADALPSDLSTTR